MQYYEKKTPQKSPAGISHAGQEKKEKRKKKIETEIHWMSFMMSGTMGLKSKAGIIMTKLTDLRCNAENQAIFPTSASKRKVAQ